MIGNHYESEEEYDLAQERKEKEANKDKDWRELRSDAVKMSSVFLERYGVPEDFHGVDLKKDFPGVYETLTASGSFFLTGSPGSGKTMAMCGMLREHALSRYHPKQCLFYSVNRFLDDLRETYNTPRKKKYDEYDNEVYEETLRVKMENVDLLCLDDIGAGQVTDWVIETLFTLIDYRLSRLRPIYFTSNLTVQELGKRYHERIGHRIMRKCRIITFEEREEG